MNDSELTTATIIWLIFLAAYFSAAALIGSFFGLTWREGAAMGMYIPVVLGATAIIIGVAYKWVRDGKCP